MRAILWLAIARAQLRRLKRSRILDPNQIVSAQELPGRGSVDPLAAQRIAKRIEYVVPRVAARVAWRSDCLVQALAGHSWLSAYGLTSEIQIGAAWSREKEFMAHAWLVHDGRVLLGGNVSGYSQLVSPKTEDVEGQLL